MTEPVLSHNMEQEREGCSENAGGVCELVAGTRLRSQLGVNIGATHTIIIIEGSGGTVLRNSVIYTTITPLIAQIRGKIKFLSGVLAHTISEPVYVYA